MSEVKLQQVCRPLAYPMCVFEVSVLMKLDMFCTGGEHKDNGLEQLIIQGEAFPVLRALILKGKSASVQEGAVRLLARLCSTPEAREQVSQDMVVSQCTSVTAVSVLAVGVTGYP